MTKINLQSPAVERPYHAAELHQLIKIEVSRF